MGSGRPETENILPESMFTGKVLPRYQNPVLRCRTFSILRHDCRRLGRLSQCRLFQQREKYVLPSIIFVKVFSLKRYVLSRFVPKLQRFLYHDAASVPAPRIWKTPY